MIIRVLRILFGKTSRKVTHSKPNVVELRSVERRVGEIKTSSKTVYVEQVREVVQNVPKTVRGKCYVVDGDTIRLGKIPIRLYGIDTPEMGDPFGNNAKWQLVGLTKGKPVTVNFTPEKSYDRFVAKCTLDDGTDLSAEMVRSGLALDWPSYSGGEYGHLEPQGVRKKLWRVNMKQGNKKC